MRVRRHPPTSFAFRIIIKCIVSFLFLSITNGETFNECFRLFLNKFDRSIKIDRENKMWMTRVELLIKQIEIHILIEQIKLYGFISWLKIIFLSFLEYNNMLIKLNSGRFLVNPHLPIRFKFALNKKKNLIG